jgi:hypothetical protein
MYIQLSQEIAGGNFYDKLTCNSDGFFGYTLSKWFGETKMPLRPFESARDRIFEISCALPMNRRKPAQTAVEQAIKETQLQQSLVQDELVSPRY